MENNNVQKYSQELATQLWAMANELRGNMDSSKFKNYILGVIFYRYLSERTEKYVLKELLKNNPEVSTYEQALTEECSRTEVVRKCALEGLGYIIEPHNLWRSLIKKINDAEFSVEDFENAIKMLVETTKGQESESAFDKLFDDMNLQDKDLGKEVSDRTSLIGRIMLKVNDISFTVEDANFDVLGTAYMILIGLFASDAGKKGGEFFTPTCASELVARLATVGLDSVKNVCDPCAGSGSLLLEAVKHTKNSDKNAYVDFYGQELNGSTYNLLRMNLLMHDVPYEKFTVFNDDTLLHDNFYNEDSRMKFHVQVANPPYSLRWSSAKTLEDDPRFSACGVLAPKSYADLAFVEHMAYHMDENGRAAILLPHGVLFRGNAEKKIREFLIGNLNCVDAVIGLPANLFHGTSIPTVCLVLSNNRKNDDNICFIDASKYYKHGKNMNELRPEDVDRIVDAYTERKEIDKFCHLATMEEVTKDNDYNCNIPRYVNTFDDEPEVDMDKLRNDLKEIRNEQQKLIDVVNEALESLRVEAM